jgi:hypothetical protein
MAEYKTIDINYMAMVYALTGQEPDKIKPVVRKGHAFGEAVYNDPPLFPDDIMIKANGFETGLNEFKLALNHIKHGTGGVFKTIDKE